MFVRSCAARLIFATIVSVTWCGSDGRWMQVTRNFQDDQTTAGRAEPPEVDGMKKIPTRRFRCMSCVPVTLSAEYQYFKAHADLLCRRPDGFISTVLYSFVPVTLSSEYQYFKAHADLLCRRPDGYTSTVLYSCRDRCSATAKS